MNKSIRNIAEKYSCDPTRLMDIFWDIQDEFGFVSDQSINALVQLLDRSRVDLVETLSFYHFFHSSDPGEFTVYLNKDVASQLNGHEHIYKAFEYECKCTFGSVSGDGKFGLFETPCIGLCDQEPAALINFVRR